MNVSELARQLKVTTNELLEQLPKLGFDVGKKAIKLDDQIAQKIIEVWRQEEKRRKEMEKIVEIRGEAPEAMAAESAPPVKEVAVPPVLTVREFASLLNLSVPSVLAELLKSGVLVSMNERIDFDTASIVGEDLGFKIVKGENIADQSLGKGEEKLKNILEAEKTGWQPRPPVAVVMGHVDHGKTKILDAIRKTDVVAGESGGITQHIGAYQVTVRPKDEPSSQTQSESLKQGIPPRPAFAGRGRDDFSKNRKITFIDTPGHEAFTAMRSRGARVADIAILVIAADSGIQPQTKEALKIIQDAKLPFIVAINKIDKPEANIEKVKQDLASIGLLPEDWGGEVICVPVSAKAGTGIDDLLKMIVLVAELEKDRISADFNRPAIGTIIESHLDRGEGPVATMLVQAGRLKAGDMLAFDDNLCGKVRALKDHKGESMDSATPGTPAKILGLKFTPPVGSILEAVKDIKLLNRDFKGQKNLAAKDSSTAFKGGEENQNFKYVNLIIKSDVLGSMEAIVESLIKSESEKAKIKIVGKGLGMITEADVLKAEATGSKIIGFHVKPAAQVVELARDKKVPIIFYEVIYHLIEDIKKEIDDLTKEDQRQLVGKLEVIKIFRREAKNMIVGGRVIEGRIMPSDTVIILRNNEPVSSGKVTRLECQKKPVSDATVHQECGLNYEGKPLINEGDVLEFFQEIK